MGIEGKEYKWFESYLHNSQPLVKISQLNFFGVPQGSILGPLLFLIYLKRIPELEEVCLYADDATLKVSASSKNEMEMIALLGLSNLKRVFLANSSISHTSKTS